MARWIRRAGFAISALWVTASILLAPVAAFAETVDPEVVEAVIDPYVHPETPNLVLIFATIVNFSIFAFIIIKFAGPAFNKNMVARRESLLAEIEEGSRLRREAEEQLAAYQAKLDAFDAERVALIEEFRELGERERARLVAEGQDEAARIVADAKALGDREATSAERGIAAKLVDKAMDLAVVDVQRQINPMVQNRLIERSIDSFKSLKAN